MTDRSPRNMRPSSGREPILVVEADADFGRKLVEQIAADVHARWAVSVQEAYRAMAEESAKASAEAS